MTVRLVRGRFRELVTPVAGPVGHANDLFLMGLLSVMDAILDQPLETVLAELPVRREIKDALLNQKGRYWKLLEIAVAHERGDWQKVSALARETRISEERISAMCTWRPSTGPRRWAARCRRRWRSKNSVTGD